MARGRTVWLALSVSASLMACGEAPPPPAAAPASAPGAPPPASAVPAETAAEPKAETAPAVRNETRPASSEDTSLKPTQKPSEILTGGNTMFVLQFEHSDAGKTAPDKCKGEGDESKQAACVQKIREKLQADAMKFRKDVGGTWYWHSMQKKGESFLFSHKVPIEFGEETERSIVLRTRGKDVGITPWAAVPKEVKIEVLNDYTITMSDPQAGKLVFEAKIGMEGQ